MVRHNTWSIYIRRNTYAISYSYDRPDFMDNYIADDIWVNDYRTAGQAIRERIALHFKSFMDTAPAVANLIHVYCADELRVMKVFELSVRSI